MLKNALNIKENDVIKGDDYSFKVISVINNENGSIIETLNLDLNTPQLLKVNNMFEFEVS